MEQPIEDFSEIRVGAPIWYLEQDMVVKANIKHEGRIEAVGWDWAIIRCCINGDSWLFLITDLRDIVLNVETMEEIETQPIFVKGVGEL